MTKTWVIVFSVANKCIGTTAKRVDMVLRNAHFSRSALAEELGVTRSAVTQKFTGKAQFTLRDLSRIADFFDVSVDFLLGRSDYAKPLEVAQ